MANSNLPEFLYKILFLFRFVGAESNSNSSIAMETFSMLLGTPKAENTSADTDRQILLDPEIDDKLRQYLYQACGQNTPAELLWKKLKQPFHTAKLAVYRSVL